MNVSYFRHKSLRVRFKIRYYKVLIIRTTLLGPLKFVLSGFHCTYFVTVLTLYSHIMFVECVDIFM